MNRISERFARLQGHFDYFLDAVRIYLGVGLFIKGISFLMHPEFLSQAGAPWPALLPLVPWVHLVGGAMLALGILPRLAALVQMPILFTAVFMVNLPRMETIRGREGVEFSALVLLLLALIAIKGAGPISIFGMRLNSAATKSPAQRWLNDHADLFTDIIRIYLGVGLIIKGAYILDHRDQLFSLVDSSENIPFLLVSAAHYVIPAHFVGGALLVIGVITRWAALVQVPILLGAMFYLALPGFAMLEQRQSLEFTGLVLFLITLIGVFGAGRYSVENATARSHAFHPEIQHAH